MLLCYVVHIGQCHSAIVLSIYDLWCIHRFFTKKLKLSIERQYLMQQKIGDCVILLLKKDYPRNFIMEEMNDDKGRDLGNRESVVVSN